MCLGFRTTVQFTKAGKCVMNSVVCVIIRVFDATSVAVVNSSLECYMCTFSYYGYATCVCVTFEIRVLLMIAGYNWGYISLFMLFGSVYAVLRVWI